MTVQTILNERNKTHGSYRFQAAMAQQIKDILHESPNWERLSPSMRESLELIAMKVSRICHGDPHHVDSWVDISGYSELIAKELYIGNL